MKAVINQSLLLKELKKMSLAIKRNPVIPILSAVKFEFGKKSVRIIATDLETTYISNVGCDCKTEFNLAIEYADIVDVCSKANAPLNIELKEKESIVVIKSDKAIWKLAIHDETTFPSVPDDTYELELNVDGDFFYHLSNANTFRSKELLKVSINMACIDVTKNTISLVGTDGFVLYKKTIQQKNKKDLKVMVCDNFVQLSKSFQESVISVGEKFIKVETDNQIIISRLSENKFPDYNVVLPIDAEYNFTANRDELKMGLSCVNVSANKKAPTCIFKFNKGYDTLNLYSQDVDLNKDAEIDISVSHSIDFEAIRLNISFTEHILSMMPTETVQMSFTAPHKAVLIKPETEDGLLCLLMPLMLTDNK